MEKKNAGILKNLAFRYLERLGSQIITFVLSIVLARLVSPEDYGLIAIANILIALSNVFTISGVANSLIHKKEIEQIDYDTAFVMNLCTTLVLYFLFFFLAPTIASIYKNEKLIAIIRVLMLVVPVSSLKTVQQAYVEKNKKYKKLIFPTITSGILSGALGIVLAMNGYGVWALVFQSITAMVLNTIFMSISVRVLPRIRFSLTHAKALASYGWKLLVADLLDTCYVQFKPVVIGIAYSTTDLAFYNKGQSFPQIIVSNITASINSILFTYMSSDQDDVEKIRELTRKTIRMCCFIVFPMMLGLCLVSKNLILVLLTEKWIDAVPFLQIMSIYFAFGPIAGAGLQGIKAIGKSNVFLIIEIIKRSIGLILLLLTFRIGTIFIAYSMLATTIISIVVNSFPQKKYYGYSIKDQFIDIFSHILLLLPMGITTFLLQDVTSFPIINLVLQIVTGVVVYIISSIITKNKEYKLLIEIIKRKTRKTEEKQDSSCNEENNSR